MIDRLVKAAAKIAYGLKLGGSPKDAVSNLGAYLFPAAGVVQGLIQAGWLNNKYQGLVIVLPPLGALLMGKPIGLDQNLNLPVRVPANNGDLQ